MNRVFLILLMLSPFGCNRTERERPGEWLMSPPVWNLVELGSLHLASQNIWASPKVLYEEEIDEEEETEEDSESVGIVVLVGGIAGGATYEVGGGAGIAWGGTAIGLGLWEFVLVGALVGVAGYGIYNLFDEEES